MRAQWERKAGREMFWNASDASQCNTATGLSGVDESSASLMRW